MRGSEYAKGLSDVMKIVESEDSIVNGQVLEIVLRKVQKGDWRVFVASI